MELVGEIVSIIVALSPLLIQIFRFISLKINNQKMLMLYDRAVIVVNALEQSDLTNDEKKAAAYKKLAAYSSKKGIKIDPETIDDNIEAAVKFLKLATQIGGPSNG